MGVLPYQPKTLEKFKQKASPNERAKHIFHWACPVNFNAPQIG
jgi:hypothetical protein